MPAYNRVKAFISAGGTGAITLGAADAGYATATSYASRTEIPYLLTWGNSYELGRGSLASDGVTFTRSAVFENSGGGDIPVGATFAIVQFAQDSISNSDLNNTPPIASGSNSLAIGCNALASGNNATAIRGTAQGNSSFALGGTAQGVGSVTINGYADAAAASSVAIGGDCFNAKEYVIGSLPDEYRRIHLRCRTTNATATVAADIDYPTDIVVPAGETWYVKTRVVGVAYNTGTLVETKAKVRNLSILAGPTGALIASTATDELNHGTFGGTATIAVTTGGVIQVTVTGIAATTIDWSIQHEIQRVMQGV